MDPGTCEVCDKPAHIHLTEVHAGSDLKQEHHYCREHVPANLQAKLPQTPADEVELVEQMLAQLDAGNDLSPAEKAEFRAELEKLAKDIAEGRLRFGDQR